MRGRSRLARWRRRCAAARRWCPVCCRGYTWDLPTGVCCPCLWRAALRRFASPMHLFETLLILPGAICGIQTTNKLLPLPPVLARLCREVWLVQRDQPFGFRGCAYTVRHTVSTLVSPPVRCPLRCPARPAGPRCLACPVLSLARLSRDSLEWSRRFSIT